MILKKYAWCLILFTAFLFSCSPNNDDILDVATELYSNPSITEMCDGTRGKKRLNGHRVIFVENRVNEYTSFYKDILLEHGIDEAIYNHFRSRLEETGLRHYYRSGDFAVFITGGMMGDIEGYLVTFNNVIPPMEGFRLTPYYYIRIEKKINERIYQIWGD